MATFKLGNIENRFHPIKQLEGCQFWKAKMVKHGNVFGGIMKISFGMFSKCFKLIAQRLKVILELIETLIEGIELKRYHIGYFIVKCFEWNAIMQTNFHGFIKRNGRFAA